MIHIKRSNALGDVLWTEPLVRYFIEKGKQVNIITLFPEIFENYPSPDLFINEPLFPVPKSLSSHRMEKRFIDLNMAYEENPKMHILEAYRLYADIPDMELSYPQIHLTPEEKKPLFTQDYVVLHIEKHASNFRNVYGVDWKKVVDHLQSLGFSVLQISYRGEDIYGEWVKTESLRKMMSLIYHSKLFIGVDSGPSHIAASFGIPSLLFFGSVNPEFRHLKTFQGCFLQSFCEYAHCYHEVIGKYGQPCRLVNKDEAPKCCTFSTETVLEALNRLSISLNIRY